MLELEARGPVRVGGKSGLFEESGSEVEPKETERRVPASKRSPGPQAD